MSHILVLGPVQSSGEKSLMPLQNLPEENAVLFLSPQFSPGLAILSLGLMPALLRHESRCAQACPAAPTAAAQTPSSYQGSVTGGEASSQPVDLTLDDAIQRGLKNNLGVILSATQTAAARGQRLSQLAVAAARC